MMERRMAYIIKNDDHLEMALDLNKYLVRHPAATFFVRVSGDSMMKEGIRENDILVVDRSLQPKDGDIVIAALNGDLTVKRLHLKGKQLDGTGEADFSIWGVITAHIRQFKGSK